MFFINVVYVVDCYWCYMHIVINKKWIAFNFLSYIYIYVYVNVSVFLIIPNKFRYLGKYANLHKWYHDLSNHVVYVSMLPLLHILHYEWMEQDPQVDVQQLMNQDWRTCICTMPLGCYPMNFVMECWFAQYLARVYSIELLNRWWVYFVHPTKTK